MKVAVNHIILILSLAYSTSSTTATLWQCDNKELIAENLLCNGHPDCSDGSDETAEYCIAGICNDYQFRCAYGACIPKESKCNFVRDCADNSDEAEYLCFKNPKKMRKELQGNCTSNKYLQCSQSGQCIPFRKRCNGVTDCDDGSDEIVKLCSTIKCASYAFRCGYGACISGRNKCNGIIDCADGSDEAAGLCGYKRKKTLGDAETETSALVTATINCVIPYREKNLIIENEATNETIVYGGKVIQGDTIKFHCKSNWTLIGAEKKKCIDTEWILDWPTCAEPANLTECQANQWRCDDGGCIHRSNRCDGAIHCADQSDETAETCGVDQCPSTSFRCNYGGCVATSAKCNGIVDCPDKSDELPIMCEQNSEKRKSLLRGNCSESTHIQCKSGECIRRSKRCNGVPDCTDGSDETMNFCINFKCPLYSFRCNYGGCIPGTDKCDGITNCMDNSDELSIVCPPPTKPDDRPTATKPDTEEIPQITTPPPPTYVPPPRPRININEKTTHSQACAMPNQPIPHLIAKTGTTKMDLRPGSQVNTETQVYFRCENDWHLIGCPKSVCINGNWAVALPRCEKYCSHSTLDKGISTTVSCFYNEKASNCSADLPIGTRAQIDCATGYHLPTSSSLSDESRPMNLTCDGTGEWDYSKFKCAPDCSSSADTAAPWYVSIYQRTEDNEFTVICGGAIISPKLIVSAVSCFTNSISSGAVANDPLLYNAVIGNYEESYLEGSDIGMPVHKISEIAFLDYSEENDPDSIATLVVNNVIELSETIKPICFEFPIHAAHVSYIETEDNIDDRKGALREYKHKGESLLVIVGDDVRNISSLLVIDYFKLQLQHELKRYNYML